MTSTSMQSNLALQGMDEEGFLTPSAKTAVRLRLEEAEPLLASDEGLALQLSRVLGIAGIGNGERWVHACRETRNLFEEVEVTLRNLLPVADLKVEEIVLGAQIHALCESLHRFDLGFRMARNGRHTADEYRKTSNFLDTLSHEIQRLNDVLLTQLPGEEGGGICALVRELSHLPMLIARQNNLSFELRHDIPLRSGDTFTLDGSSRFLVLERQEDGHLRLISHSYSDNPYEQVFLHEKIVYDAATIISRGGRNELYISREPFSSFQPILDGSHVIASPFDETRRDYAFGECISLRKTGGRDLAGLERKVLWHLHDGSARLEEFKESNLRTLDPRSDGRNGAQSVLSKSRYEALSAIAKSVENLPAQRDRESRELQALCNAVLQAELPIALHIMGSAYACRKHEALNSLSSTMVQVTTEGLPTEDPNHLRAHMCIPVLLVLESEKETALHSQIVELKKKGWEVIVVQNEDSLPDYFIKWAIEDNGVRVPEEQFTVIESTSGDVAERITETLLDIGKRGREALDLQIECKLSDSEIRANISQELASQLTVALDHLAEASPSRPITQRPRDLQLLRSIVQHPESTNHDVDGSDLHALTRTFDSPLGRTDMPTEWSRRQLVELSGALAKSRLSPSHPAVILRGITCLDLSPRALEALLQKGAHFIRVADDGNDTRGVVISLPPEVTDSIKPGFSKLLQHDGRVGYVYWIWLDPTLSNEIHAPYAKLVNGMVFDQLQDGTGFICGMVLAKNSPSLRAALGICGFDVLPIQTKVGGESAIGVGFNLEGWDGQELLTQPERNARSIMAQSIDIFARGVASNTLDETALGELRLRVTTTADFLAQQRAFRCSCQDILAVARSEVAWEEIDTAAKYAESALEALAHWLTPSQVSDLEDTIQAITDDELRSNALKHFQDLLLEVVPESEREISRLYSVLTTKAQEHLELTLDPLPAYVPMRPTTERSRTLPLAPSTDSEMAAARYDALSETVQWYLYHWRNSLRDKLMTVRDDQSSQGFSGRIFRQWVQSNLQRSGAFLWPSEVPNDWKDGYQLTAHERQHLEEFTAIISWANGVARAGHFDLKFGKHAWRLLVPYLEGEKDV